MQVMKNKNTIALTATAIGTGLLVRTLKTLKKMENPSPVLTLKAIPDVFRAEMFQNPYSLPRLPIPALEDTAAKYLKAVRPFADDAEYANQEKLMKEFTEGVGAELHKELVAKDAAAAKSGSYPYSYIEECWDKMYYGLRCPAPINFSPYFAVSGLTGGQ
eukprot:6479988-Pyramimonas_sp.AAC.1